jgi:threonine aldolase
VIKDFGSDNHAGAHPDVLRAIEAANDGSHAPSYGEDRWTLSAEELFREHFGPEAKAWLLLTGTGANVAAIDSVTRPFEAVICTDTAHIWVDECGAVERLTGTRLLPRPTVEGKLTVADVLAFESRRGDVHSVQPRLVSITQATECGTVYSPAETRALADAAHERGMLLHVDGARLANAAAALGVPLRTLTTDAGVDVVSFGGTKNGKLLGEAVVFCGPGLGEKFGYTRKQVGQLASKSRFLAAQFEALLSDDLWLRNAHTANAMATRLAEAIRGLDGVELAHPVEANAVFARLPQAALDHLTAALPSHSFYVWDPARREIRLMCSWDTTPEDVDRLVESIAAAAGQA